MESDILAKYQSNKSLLYLIVMNGSGGIICSKPEIKEENKEEKAKIEEMAKALFASYITIKEINEMVDSTKAPFIDARLRYKKSNVTIIPNGKFIMLAVQGKD